MQSTPLLKYKVPRYPTKLEVLADRALVQRHLPAPWLRRSEVAAGLALALGVNHGCFWEQTSCMVMIPPVYMSEEQAMRIIIDEANKNGLALSMDEKAIAAIMLPFKVDAADPDHNVAVEYVSREDCVAYDTQPAPAGVVEDGGGREDAGPGRDAARPYSGECEWSTATVANELESRARQAQTGVELRAFDSWFYGSEENAELMLRQEVVDFVDYLRSTGVI